MTPEREWNLVHGVLLIGRLESLGYIEGGSFSVNVDNASASKMLMAISHGFPRPSDETIVEYAMRLMSVPGIEEEDERLMRSLCEQQVAHV